MNETKPKYEEHVIEHAKANRDDIRQKLACGKVPTPAELAQLELYNEMLGEET